MLRRVETNLDYLRTVVATPEFRHGAAPPASWRYGAPTLRHGSARSGHAKRTVQDYPGRVGIGTLACSVRPHGPTGVRLAKSIGGQWPILAAALECTMTGPASPSMLTRPWRSLEQIWTRAWMAHPVPVLDCPARSCRLCAPAGTATGAGAKSLCGSARWLLCRVFREPVNLHSRSLRGTPRRVAARGGHAPLEPLGQLAVSPEPLRSL